MITKIVTVKTGLSEKEKQDLVEAASIINSGGLVIFPTETVYGLGADGTSSFAAEKIFAAKGRPADNPLIIHIAKPSDAEKYTFTNELYYKLADAFMPGPLTIVLKAKETVPLSVRGGLDTVAVRCPIHPVANKLIELSKVPIAAPSANISGRPSPTCAKHVIEDMDGRVDMIIDGGECDFGLESTIVKIDSPSQVTLLRPGKISTSDLLKVVPNVEIASAVMNQLKAGEKALSPGMKYRHYAPEAPVYLLNGDFNSRQKYISEQKGNIAYLCYNNELDTFSKILNPNQLFPFGDESDLLQQAHLLFYQLREIDDMKFDAIYAPLPPKEGIGLALYNRMIRAAAHNIIEL